MGLKENIMVRSEYSLNTGRNKGTKGGTPGKFVMRYMTRREAVENIAPTTLSESEHMLLRYEKRAEFAESAKSVREMQAEFEKTQKKGGIAFCNRDAAMSDAAVRENARDIQDHFNRGHTAIKTVISFDTEYLKQNGILPPDFEHKKKGDYVGHVDHLKLRMAIMNGMEKLSTHYDDLRYTAVIHTNASNVHCHLLLMDFGHGTLIDGTQRGKLRDDDKKAIRRGIDSFLDEKQTVKMMSSSVSHDKRNALCYVKKFTHQTMAQQGVPQFLLACLPENRNWWSANSNRAEMRKSNTIVRDYVLNILQPQVGPPCEEYRDAHQSIVAYADARQVREGFSENERMKLIRNGEERLVKDCMNGVYSVLKQIPKEEMKVRTPMLEAMSMDYESMAAQAVDDPMMEFGFRLRSYSSRLSTHRKNYHKFKSEYEDYEEAENKSKEAEALGEHLKLEMEYQHMLMVKYQHFLAFLPPDDSIQAEFDDVMRQQDRLERMQKMTEDPSFLRMGDISGDRYGLKVYGIRNGHYIKTMPNVWDRNVEQEREKVAASVKNFRERLQDYGFDFDGHGVVRQTVYSFDEVKALDLHHLGHDFPYDAPISRVNVDRFVEMANRRYESFQKAKEYLVRTGQEDAVQDLMPQDVETMKRFADQFSGPDKTLKSIRPGAAKKHNGSTIRLGRDYTVEMESVVRNITETTRYYE